MSEEIWLVPDYYPDFSCKCGSCRRTCCYGWEVDIGMKDYYRLIGMECSDELHRRIECAFADPEERSERQFKKIAPNWYGLCPFLNDAGLCALQLECGAEVLPEVCRCYPRSIKSTNGILNACCSCSCEAVVELLERPEKLTFREMRLPVEPEMRVSAPYDLPQMHENCVRALRDESKLLRERILDVCRLADEDLAAPDRGKRMRAIGGCAEESENFAPYAKRILERGNADGSAVLRERFPLWERWLENWLVNHLLYCDFPYPDGRIRPADAAYGLYLAFEILSLTGEACAADGASKDELTDAVAAAFHLIEHTSFYYNAYVLMH